MIEVDGSMHSGSGTLLRYAAVLATLLGESLHMYGIRASRDKPGLRPQHLVALKACAGLSRGELEGAEINAREIRYRPGLQVKGGSYHWDIGTAGSTTMLAFALLPLALYADGPCTFTLTGGLFQDFAPSAFHMQRVLLPLVRKMGGEVQLEIIRPGYVPQGRGVLRMQAGRLRRPLRPLRMPVQGNITKIGGVALSSHLRQERVSDRMARECARLLGRWKYPLNLDICYDETAVQKGAALMLRAETDTGCLLGSDQAGKRGRRSESIADFVVKTLMEDVRSGATTDRHLADQLILFAALAENKTEYVLPAMTDHVQSNLWLVRELLGVGVNLQGNHLTIEGIGLDPSRIG